MRRILVEGCCAVSASKKMKTETCYQITKRQVPDSDHTVQYNMYTAVYPELMPSAAVETCCGTLVYKNMKIIRNNI